MAPRTGPRGVTNEDVANRAGVTYVYQPETPAQQQQALLSYVLGGEAPGYGMKYGGFPTAGYGQSAIEGQAFGIADLARQAAQQAAVREAELKGAASEDVGRNLQAVASKYRYDYRPSAQVRELGMALGQAEDNTSKQLMARAQLKAAVESERKARQTELENLQEPILRKLETDIRSQVEPYRQVSQTLGAYSPSQLAQQIAVSRYGYDPMLAAGLFGGQTDINYATQVRGLEEAQRRAMGYDTSLTNDEILAQTLSPEEFQAYQLAKANAAYENATKPNYSQEDIALFDVYGTTPSNESERQIMLDPSFRTLVEKSKQRMLEADAAINPNAEIATIVREFVQTGGNPAYAIMLDDILSRFSFLIEPLGANVNVNV